MPEQIEYVFDTQLELNHAYMPFIKNGGIFIPIKNPNFCLGDEVNLRIRMPERSEFDQAVARVVWITPDKAINHLYPGVGLQLIGDNAQALLDKIKSNLDNTVDTGGYIYGVSHEVV